MPMCMNELRVMFDLGEERRVAIEIVSCLKEDFEILSAEYTLVKVGTDVPEQEGSCDINAHEISVKICPKNTGTYRLKFTYRIADETLIDIVKVRVD